MTKVTNGAIKPGIEKGRRDKKNRFFVSKKVFLKPENVKTNFWLPTTFKSRIWGRITCVLFVTLNAFQLKILGKSYSSHPKSFSTCHLHIRSTCLFSYDNFTHNTQYLVHILVISFDPNSGIACPTYVIL